jgi:hypothetical protein
MNWRKPLPLAFIELAMLEKTDEVGRMLCGLQKLLQARLLPLVTAKIS